MADPVGRAVEGNSRPTNCLLSLQDPGPLFSPLGSSTRIKYTCISASPHYIALGANTGGVYCFHRDGPRYIRLLANKEGGLSHVRFSPDESCLAVVIGGCHLAFWELSFREKGESKRLNVSSLFKDSTIRDLVWDGKGARLFYGDNQGRVGVAYVPKHLKKLSSSSLFRKPDEIIYHDRSPIVQLDFHQEMLLVSTQARGVLVKLSSREVVQVGKKSRDGPFGACFHRRWSDHPPVVYSARPGGRLWEADVEGTVLSTLKLRDLVSIPATPILGRGFSPKFSTGPPNLTQALNFTRLRILSNQFMIAWLENGLFLFDSASYKLAAWNCDVTGIVDVCCDDRQLLVLYEGGRRVAGLVFWPLGVCLQELVKYGELQQAEMLLMVYSSEIATMLQINRALYLPVKTTIDFSKSISDDLTDGLRSVQSALTSLEESTDLVSLETDPGSTPYQLNNGEGSTELTELESSGEIENLQSQNANESGTTLGMSQEQFVVDVPQLESTSESDVSGQNLHVCTVPVDTDLPLPGEMKVTGNQSTAAPESTDLVEQGSHGNMPNSIANEGSYPADDSNLDMHVGFEEVDFGEYYDYPVDLDQGQDQGDSAHQVDTGLRDVDQDQGDSGHQIDTSPHDIDQDKGDLTHQIDTGKLQSTSETELTADLQPKRTHSKSNSWGGISPDLDLDSNVRTLKDEIQPSVGEPDQNSTHEHLVRAYPESTGIEIPRPQNLPWGPEISDQDDPFALQTSTSGPSSLETTSSLGAEMEISLPSKQPETTTELLPKFLRSNSLSAVKSEVTTRLSSALKRKSHKDDVIAVPVKGSGSGSREGGGKSKGKRKTSKRKKVSSPALMARRMSNPDTGANPLMIPEDEILPFPEVAFAYSFAATPTSPSHAPVSLPHSPSHSHFSSAATSRSISPLASQTPSPPKGPSILTDLNPMALLSKVRSITTQQSTFEKTEMAEDVLKMESPSQSSTVQGLSLEGLEKGETSTAAAAPQRVEREFQVSVSEKTEIVTLSLGTQTDKNTASSRAHELEGSDRSDSVERKEKGSPGPLGRKSDGVGRVTKKDSEQERPTAIVGVPKSSGSSLFSKMKSIAKQGGQNIGLESEKIQRPMRMVKGLFSSLTNPNPHSSLTSTTPPQRSSLTPSALPQRSLSGGYYDSQVVFRNEDYLHQTSQTSLTSSTGTSPSEQLITPPMSEATLALPQDPETKAFSTATMDTMLQLEDPAVISSPDELKQQLKQWLHELDKFRRHAQSGMESKQPDSGMGTEQHTPELEPRQLLNSSTDIFRSSCYQCLQDSAMAAVTELATLCAELDVFISSEGLDSMRALLASCLSVVDGWRVRVAVGEREWAERRRLWSLMGEREIEGDYAETLIADDVDSAVGYITAHQSELATDIPAYMIRLFEARPRALIDLCVKSYPYIMPWEVAVACGIDQSEATTISRDSQSDSSVGGATYAQYLSRVSVRENDSCPVSAAMQNDPQLLLVSMETLLKQGPSMEELATASGSPRPFSHLPGLRHQPILEVLVDTAVAMGALHQEACRALCEKHGYWLGAIQLAVSLGNTRPGLHTLLSLRDMRLFTEKQKWGQVLDTVEDWRLLLQLMSEMRIAPCRETVADPGESPRKPGSPMQNRVTVTTATEFQPRNVELPGGSTSETVTGLTGFDFPASPGTNTGSVLEEMESSEIEPYSHYARKSEIETVEESSGEMYVREQSIAAASDAQQSPLLDCHRTHSSTPWAGQSFIREEREVDKFELTWLGVFRLMLGRLGPEVVGELLSGVDTAAWQEGGALQQQLHSLLVRLTAVRTQQRRVAHSLLEKMDRYLWSQRPTALSPQLRAVQDWERQQCEARPSPGTVTTVPSFSPCLEDAASHWGIKIGGNRTSHGGVCGVCRVSVLRTVSDRLPGVIAFQCGHAYHRQCLSEQACLICFTANLRERHRGQTES